MKTLLAAGLCVLIALGVIFAIQKEQVSVPAIPQKTATQEEPTTAHAVSSLNDSDTPISGRQSEEVTDHLAPPQPKNEATTSENSVPESILSVTDEYGAPLSNVELVCGLSYESELWSHPFTHQEEAGEEILRFTGHSPFRLNEIDPSLKHEFFFARADGFAWTMAEVNRERGGQTELRLKSGGDLSIEVFGLIPEVKVWLRIRPIGAPIDNTDELGLEKRAKSQQTIRSFRSGEYRISAELGTGQLLTLAYQNVHLVANDHQHIILDVGFLESPILAQLGGTLLVSPIWNFNSLGIYVHRVDGVSKTGHSYFSLDQSQLTTLNDETGHFAWALPEVEVGSYEIIFGPIGSRVRVDLGPEGKTDIELAIAPPAQARINFVDASTGAIAEIDSVAWRPHSETQSRATFNGAGHQEDYFRFRAPVGPVEIMFSSKAYQGGFQSIELQAGLNEFVVEVTKR